LTTAKEETHRTVALRKLGTQIWAQAANGGRTLIALAATQQAANQILLACSKAWEVPVKDWTETDTEEGTNGGV
jgi:hypothetical protein